MSKFVIIDLIVLLVITIQLLSHTIVDYANPINIFPMDKLIWILISYIIFRIILEIFMIWFEKRTILDKYINKQTLKDT